MSRVAIGAVIAAPEASPVGRSSEVPGAAIANFLERRGHRVLEAGGVYWAHYRGPFYSSLPYHRIIDAAPEEIQGILRRLRIPSVRFPSMRHAGIPAGIYACRPAEFDLKKLSRQTRTNVQRGMESCVIRSVDPDELLAEGLQLNLDTMERQRRFDQEFGDPAAWKRFVDGVRNTPGIEVRGAYAGDRLLIYIVACREDGWLHLLYKMSRNETRAMAASHALDYSFIRDAAAEGDVHSIGNSYVSVLANAGLDEYKRRMGFTVDPHTLAIYFHPTIAGVVTSRLACRAAAAAWKHRPGKQGLELAARITEGARITRTTMTSQLPIVDNGAVAGDLCQHTGCTKYARAWRPYPLFLLHVARNYLRQQGWQATAKKTEGFVAARLSRARNGKPAAVRTPYCADEALGLQAGEWVEVKSEAEIRATLDAQGKHRGMAFVPVEMLRHCGGQYRVYKRVEKIFLEESRQNRKLKNTVLLDGVQCQGIGLDCDRCCYLFWREAWLKRVEGPRP
ncbi:MAG: hypothetical protein KIT09_28260 [Bryobacteraceae bacterium]|nr:hypothetical protein [Bryobacteraceae bacterium]